MDAVASAEQHRQRPPAHAVKGERAGTTLAPEISEALAKQRTPHLLARVRRSPRGRSLLQGRPEFRREGCDLAELLRLPHGMFGHEFARWMLDNGLEPGADDAASDADASDQDYLARRLIEVHDLWHVLTGYNCDLAGEFGVLAFTLGQGHLRGVAPALAASLKLARDRSRDGRSHRVPLARYLWQAYRRGRRARFLAPLELEEYFTLPIDSVRQRLRIDPCEEALDAEALPPIAIRPPNEHGLLSM
jgi:ubiquinone biosynthesis protein COQ4